MVKMYVVKISQILTDVENGPLRHLTGLLALVAFPNECVAVGAVVFCILEGVKAVWDQTQTA